jgi:hypothetical protein
MPGKKLITRNISWAEVHDLFVLISDKFGFKAEEFEDEIAELIELWESQGFVEIYQSDEDRKHGRIKDSSLSYGASPHYIGLFHVRLSKGHYDPLIVICFDSIDGETVASLRFMLNHDHMFGTIKEKNYPVEMRAIRVLVDKFIQEGHQK